MRDSTALAVLLASAALAAATFGGSYVQFLVASAIVYLLVGIGLNVLTGYGGYVSVGHAAFWAIGAYGSALSVQVLNVPFLIGLLIGGTVAAIAGAAVALPALRVKGHYLAIATMAFALLVQQVLFEWESVTGGRQGLTVPRPAIFGHVLQDDLSFIYLTLPLALAVCWMVRNFCTGFSGKALLALKTSEIAAQCAGLSRARHLFYAFTLSAFCTGLSGALYAHLIGYLSADTFTFATSISFLTMIVIGGTSALWGALLGAVFLTVVPEWLRAFGNAQTAIYGLALILSVRFMPDGLVGLFNRFATRPRSWAWTGRPFSIFGERDGPS
jgi:branched-chain amino acid transport system permease protein